MVKTHVHTDKTTIILTPNRSASWYQVKWLLIIIGTFVLGVAVAWSFVGAWIVLPFAGFEIALLSILMIKVNRLTNHQQVITVADNDIKVESGMDEPDSVHAFKRGDAHLEIIEPEHSMDKARLTLTDQQTSLELGAFLNQQDCQLARTQLKQAGLIVCSNKWWRAQ